MKTSVYFVLWIIIYPILGLLGFSDNSFIFAFIAIIGLSWLINKSFSNLIAYENITQTAPIYEDVYNGNVSLIIKRLTREFIVETITAIYLLMATIIMGYVVFKLDSSSTIGLVIIGLICAGAIIRSNKLHKALGSLKADISTENCEKVMNETYMLNCASYREMRQNNSYDSILPPRPRYYSVFNAVMFLFTIACILLGSFYIIISLIPIIFNGFSIAGLFYIMQFLYGSLALYFGVKDLTALLSARKKQ